MEAYSSWRRCGIFPAAPWSQREYKLSGCESKGQPLTILRPQAFIYYAPTLFRSLGQTDEMSLVLSGVFNTLQILGVVFAFLLIDRVGRRPLAIGGGLGNLSCYIVIAALAGTYDGRWVDNANAGWACVAFAFLFIIIFGATYSPLGWALPSEVFPVSIRSKGVAFSGMSHGGLICFADSRISC